MQSNIGKNILSKYRDIIDTALKDLCKNRYSEIPPRLWGSMTYSLLAGGKRVRPVLCLLSGKACGASVTDIMPMALACEMVHTASLIHDDLPAMDNDNLRRGKPTNHVIYGEPLALIAGDALFLWAFDHALSFLSQNPAYTPECILDALGELLHASGPFGICGGQVMDSDPESISDRDVHPWVVSRAKTASLIRSSILSGAILGGASETDKAAFSVFGESLGTAFQIVDDIIDVVGEESKIGKTPGKDQAQGKISFVASYGLEGAKKLADLETKRAIQALSAITGDISELMIFPELLRERSA